MNHPNLQTSRRECIVGLAILASAAACTASPRLTGVSSDDTSLSAIEAGRGGRIGVFAKDLETGRTLAHRSAERFAMCSTFKWMLAGQVLQRCDAGTELLSRKLGITEDHLVSHSPVSLEHVGSGLSIERLCEAAITVSDNTAANLLLKTIGGPAAFTAALRDLGDRTTRLDRYETELNEAAAGDPRDTTTPSAMVKLLEMFLHGGLLSKGFEDKLRAWMLATRNGANRLPAGSGGDWAVGHKPGTNNRNVNNSVAFFESRSDARRAPILIASFSDGPAPTSPASNDAHAQVAQLVLRQFTSFTSSEMGSTP